MSPLRTGFRYGLVAVVIALVADLRYLLITPGDLPNWILTVIETFRTQAALAAFLFLSILAALRVRPVRVEADVPYRSLLLRDGALAATVVSVMAGLALLVATGLNSTVLADNVRAYASDAAPYILEYNAKVAGRLDEPPPLPPVGEIEAGLQPPEPRDVGRSLANLVLRSILLGTVGAIVGALRGSFGKRGDAGEDAPPRSGAAEGTPGA
ncbi:hypothetical protein GBA65_11830 [Rubrobacter marinus]|uniref:DUF4199 domain-containing protein n=1 Tax=Rubrobacter marinus TaxID=2653852 RepID=A0A6G8PY19_9ACTN|nr:hypothetical protein [Rubrobacter marinus]QIN79096.1 hypothetical protein GBA65_11830 [Rubrobacter marinus]